MGDMADVFNGWREHKRKKRASNTESSTNFLRENGIQFESKNGGAHLIVASALGPVDFWPSTGLWHIRSRNQKGRGVITLRNTLHKATSAALEEMK